MCIIMSEIYEEGNTLVNIIVRVVVNAVEDVYLFKNNSPTSSHGADIAK